MYTAVDKAYVAYLHGYTTSLVLLDKERDAETLMHFINDPETNRYLLYRGPCSIEDEISYIERSISQPEKNLSFGIVVNNRLIGTIGLNIQITNRTAETGSLIGLKEYRGKGYSTDARFALLRYAFEVLNLRKVCSRVVEINHASIRSLEKCGYKEEARQHDQIELYGQYYDLVYLALYKDDFVQVYAEYSEKMKLTELILS